MSDREFHLATILFKLSNTQLLPQKYIVICLIKMTDYDSSKYGHVKRKGKGKRTCIAPLMKLHLKALRYGSHRVVPANYTIPASTCHVQFLWRRPLIAAARRITAGVRSL